MNGKVILKNTTSGLYFVDGAGFVEKDAGKATALSSDEAACTQNCAKRMGHTSTAIEPAPQSVSFAVCYIRQVDLVNGQVQPNAKNPSRRRFATRDEANTHGRRFNVRRANYGAPPGSAGHLGFYVIETTDPVNSVINPNTGLTNPAPGCPRTYAERMAAKARGDYQKAA